MDELHIEINDFVQKVFDDKGIRINKIEINWIDISHHGECKFISNNIKIETASRKKVLPMQL